MKRRLFSFALAALTIGLLGSCSKINERIDGLDKRVYDIENEKIASIENQIAAINQSIAGLETIRTNIQNLKNAQEAQGQDITALKAADITLEGKINDLKAYVNTELAKYATKDWANAAFATLGQLNTTNTELGALKETVGNLGETTDAKIAGLKTELTKAIDNAIAGVNASISALEARVSAIEKMIQSVSITPAYSDGSVEAVDGILTLKCIVSPAEALIGMESLKDSLLIYADSVKVKTKGASAYMKIEVSEASVLDAAQGAITLTADISEYLPKGEDKALTVAVNIKNGISNFTTEFVPVSVAGPDIPEGALSGEFSIAEGKKVYFSQGNLWYGTVGDAQTATFNFEANQYGFKDSWDATHVSHFFWSKDASVACAGTYSESGTTGTDVFFTNADGFKVNVGGKEQSGWRTLSTKEWQYLFNTRTMKNGKDRYTPNITYGGKMGLVLYPDDYDNDPIHGSVETMPEGVVFLPAAGDRIGSYVYDVGGVGIYWSSSAYDEGSAYYVFLDSGSVIPDYSDGRSNGFSVRLVTEVPASASTIEDFNKKNDDSSNWN